LRRVNYIAGEALELIRDLRFNFIGGFDLVPDSSMLLEAIDMGDARGTGASVAAAKYPPIADSG